MCSVFLQLVFSLPSFCCYAWHCLGFVWRVTTGMFVFIGYLCFIVSTFEPAGLLHFSAIITCVPTVLVSWRLFVCMSVYSCLNWNKTTDYKSVYITCYEYVLRWTVEVFTFLWHFTIDLDSCFCIFLDNKSCLQLEKKLEVRFCCCFTWYVS